MRESSPALGGALVAVAVVVSLTYAMGYGHQLTDLASAAAAQADGMLIGLWHTMQQAINGTG